MWTVVIYIVVLLVAAFVRFWTEGGFWQAIHTGRTFMLQATTLTVGIGITYLDLLERLNILKPYVPPRAPSSVKDALTPPLSRLLSEPMSIFFVGAVFLIGYILTGFFERDFLTKVGNPPHPKKYVGLNDEPTRTYKIFIRIMLCLGTACLLVAWYFVPGSTSGGVRSYVYWFVIPTYIFLFLLLWVGPKIQVWLTGTEGRPQPVDLRGIPGKQD
jgi:hypothetical protein